MSETFSEILTEKMNARHMNCSVLAYMIQRDLTTVFHYTKGSRIPKLDSLEKIRTVLGDEDERLKDAWEEAKGINSKKFIKEFDEDKATFAELVRFTRLSLGMTLEQFAKHIESTESSITNWENNHSIPNPKTLKRLMKYFTVSTDKVAEMVNRSQSSIHGASVTGKYEMKYGSAIRDMKDIPIKQIDVVNVSLAEAIVSRRRELQLSQNELTEKLHMAKPMWTLWEQGTVMMPQKVVHIADLLRLDIFDLAHLYTKAYPYGCLSLNAMYYLRFYLNILAGVGQAQFFKLIGANLSSFHKYELCNYDATDKMLEGFAEVVGLSVDNVRVLHQIPGDYYIIEDYIRPSIKRLLKLHPELKDTIPDGVIAQYLEV